MEKEKEENRKRSKITRVLAIVVIILLLLALTVCLIIIFTHRHAMTYYSAAEATCTTDGNAEYWYCAGCNSYFEDENGNNKIERDDVLVSAKGHSWVGESCEAPRHCSVCNYVDGEPLGHDFSEYIFDGNAACTSDGTETATCTRCDATHTQISYGSAIGHDYVESVVAATCTSSGSVSLICSVCGDSEVATIPATGEHSWDFENGEVTPATGTTEGKIIYGCTVCSETLEVAFPATGEHSWQFDKGEIKSIATCTTEGEIVYGCADCSEVLTIKIPVNAAAHSYDAGVVIKPSCTSDGEVLFTCEHCGVELSAEISATGHSWISATCTSARECATCGAVSGSALGHSWGDWTSAGDSRHSRECSRCHNVEYSAHDFGGAEYGTCTVCGYTKEQPATDEGTLIEALVEFWNSRASGVTYFDSNGDLDITLSGLFGYSYYLMCGTNNNIVFSLYNYDYNEVLSSDMQLSVSILDGYQDLYVTLQNDSNPDIKIEYHPIRYTLYVYNESANGGAGDFEVLSDENKTYQDLTIKELNSALADGVLNRTFAEGSGMDFTFRIEWEWAFMLDDGEVFEIKDAEGNTYSFNQDNIDKLDTDLENVINVGYPEHGTISDTDNNTWTVLNRSDAGGNLLYNDEFAFDINVSLNSI